MPDVDDMHECPGPDCERRVPSHMLACRRHWGQVSRPTQQAVYGAWKRGAGAGTDEHLHAMSAAIAEMKP